jgi:hypothetical protein
MSNKLTDLAVEVLPAILVEIAYNAVDALGNFMEWLTELLGVYTYN